MKVFKDYVDDAVKGYIGNMDEKDQEKWMYRLNYWKRKKCTGRPKTIMVFDGAVRCDEVDGINKTLKSFKREPMTEESMLSKCHKLFEDVIDELLKELNVHYGFPVEEES